MKLITGVFFVCLIVSGMAQLTSTQQAQIGEIFVKCKEELGVTLDASVFKSGAYDGTLFNDDTKDKMFSACFLTKMGVVSPDGMILGSKLIEFLTEGNVPAEVKDTVDKCVAVGGDSFEDRAYNFHKCYWAGRVARL